MLRAILGIEFLKPVFRGLELVVSFFASRLMSLFLIVQFNKSPSQYLKFCSQIIVFSCFFNLNAVLGKTLKPV